MPLRHFIKHKCRLASTINMQHTNYKDIHVGYVLLFLKFSQYLRDKYKWYTYFSANSFCIVVVSSNVDYFVSV